MYLFAFLAGFNLCFTNIDIHFQKEFVTSQLFLQTSLTKNRFSLFPFLRNSNDFPFLAYLTLVFKELSRYNLAEAVDRPLVKVVLRSRPSDLSESILAIIRGLELLLRWTNGTVFSIQLINLVAEIVLGHYLVRAQDAAKMVTNIIQMHEDQIDLSESEDAKVDTLWAIMDLALEAEWLEV